MTLVSYAGFDRNEHRPLLKPKHAYKRFLAGQDTAELARFYRVSESTVQRWIDAARKTAEAECPAN